jgi:prepilin-type processing-associated H-X9-DG protein
MRDYNINGRPKTDDEPAEPTHGHVFSVAPGRMIMGRSNYLGCGGDYRGHNSYRRDEKDNPNYEPYRGVFHYNSKVSLSQILDGASATLMFGEIAGGYIDWTRVPGARIPNGWASPSWSAGFNYVTFGLCPDKRADQHNCDFSPEGKGLSFGTFGSLHEGNVIHFAFCDGSVRPLRPTIPTSVLLALGGYQDGVVLSLDD